MDLGRQLRPTKLVHLTITQLSPCKLFTTVFLLLHYAYVCTHYMCVFVTIQVMNITSVHCTILVHEQTPLCVCVTIQVMNIIISQCSPSISTCKLLTRYFRKSRSPLSTARFCICLDKEESVYSR